MCFLFDFMCVCAYMGYGPGGRWSKPALFESRRVFPPFVCSVRPHGAASGLLENGRDAFRKGVMSQKWRAGPCFFALLACWLSNERKYPRLLWGGRLGTSRLQQGNDVRACGADSIMDGSTPMRLMLAPPRPLGNTIDSDTSVDDRARGRSRFDRLSGKGNPTISPDSIIRTSHVPPQPIMMHVQPRPSVTHTPSPQNLHHHHPHN